jgi:hypothetical protein
LEAYSLLILLVAIFVVIGWAGMDNRRHDREGAKARKAQRVKTWLEREEDE